ncbi:hypothetical protein Rhopal_003875-T1 [Rhodotorula paludigena]|uniref:DNA replication checkpoint mediator MRC1 domain-containing protein n=1 Tax=Rhodotorula paludigena TaxID=86838 RepID=A0AAV5GEN3_9BASI|nr:hypothetical protein Rhopal_003875-T1 [Rhodotorula paludigena]
MASMEVEAGDMQSPDLAPTSLAVSESSSPTLPPSRPAPDTTAAASRVKVTRTYGRKKPEVDEAAAGPALDRQATIVIPDSEPGAAPVPPYRASARLTPVSDDEETDRAVSLARTSSPTRRNVHSTDPTSEDDSQEKSPLSRPSKSSPARARRSTSVVDESSDGEGSDGDNDGSGAFAFLKRGGVQDLLADIDRDFDSRADEAPVQPAAGALPHPTSSSLPTLTDTDKTISRLPSSSSQRSPSTTAARRRAIPSSSPARSTASGGVLDEIENLLGDDDLPESEEPVRPSSAFPRARKSRAIADSDEDEDSGPAQPGAQHSYAAPAPSELTAREKVALLAAQKREKADAAARRKREEKAAARVEEEPEEDAIEEDEEDALDRAKGKGKKAGTFKTKTKSLNKKIQDEMNRTTAAYARQQEAHLAPVQKKGKSVMDALKAHTISSAPMPSMDRTASTMGAEPLVITSSDSIQPASSQPQQTPRAAFGLSLKALGKQRESSPIYDIHQTPAPYRPPQRAKPAGYIGKKAAPEPAAADNDDDEDLVSPEEMMRRQNEKRAEETRRRALQERKAAAVRAAQRAAAAAAVVADSDSDLEIEDPNAKKQLHASSRALGKTDTLAVFAQTPARPRNDARRVLQRFAGIDVAHPPSDDVDPSESQLQAAGKEFGRNLDPKYHHVPTPAKKGTASSSTTKARKKAGAAPEAITLESLDHMLLGRAKQQNHAARLKKQTRHRQQQLAAAAAGGVDKPELESVDVKAMLEKKKRDRETQEDEEDAEDGDYQDDDGDEEEYNSAEAGDEGDEDLDMNGSGSDVPVGRAEAEDEDEGEVDSEGELVMPRSSQNSERLAQSQSAALVDAADEEDEEDEMPPPALTRRPASKIRVADADEDAESRNSAEPAPTELVKTPGPAAPPPRMALGGLFGAEAGSGDGGGFSQFFDSQFSQGGGDDQGDGFARPAGNDDLPAATMFAQPLISTAERAADAARLEARGGFNDFEPGTPREAPAPRQYINDKGFLTQTRPANFADSPSDSPAFAYRQSLSTLDSQSQAFFETQFASAETPTQASRDPTKLRRAPALTSFDSLPALAATEVQPEPTEVVSSRSAETPLDETQVVEETLQDAQEDAQDETQDETLPSAAQPTATAPNAFDALRAGAMQQAQPAQPVSRRRQHNAFVDEEAGMDSEEEGYGLGGVSGDEDETGHDAELQELVDNAQVDEELEAEQNRLAEERYREDEEKAEQERLKQAQRIADGKERQKRKGFDLSDDEFDDDYVRHNGPREKKARVESLTIGQLKENEETKAFGDILAESCVASKAGDFSFLETQHESSDEEDEGDDEGESGAFDVFGRAESLAPLPKRSYRDAQQIAIQQQRERDEALALANGVAADEDSGYMRGFSPNRHVGGSGSSVAAFKCNIAVAKSTTIVRTVDDFAELDSQTLVFGKQVSAQVQYRAADRSEESQTAGATALGGRGGAVTSFMGSKNAAKKASTSASSKSKSSTSMALGPKPSKLGGLRRGKFDA